MSSEEGLHTKFLVYKAKRVTTPVCGCREAACPHERVFDVGKVERGEPVTDCFVLRPGKDEVARRALFTYAIETQDEELRADLLAWLDKIATAEERELRTQGACLLWCMWHGALASFESWKPQVRVSVPIYERPPGFSRRVVRMEVEERERFMDAVHALGKRLWTGSSDFNLESLARHVERRPDAATEECTCPSSRCKCPQCNCRECRDGRGGSNG